MSSKRYGIVWVANGAGLNSNGISGGALRLHETSKRMGKYLNCNDSTSEIKKKQLILTTPGGKKTYEAMGNPLETQVLPASLFMKKEPFKAFRFYSYIITSIAAYLRQSKLPKCDVIVSYSCDFVNLIPSILMKKKNHGSKLIVILHHRYNKPKDRPGNKIVNTIMYKAQTWSYKKIVKHADFVWTYDTDMGDKIVEEVKARGMLESQIVKVECGIDYDSIREVEKSSVKKTVDAVLIGVRPSKGMWDIVPIWKEVQKIRPGTTLRLMGGMIEVNKLKSDIDEAGLSDIIAFFQPKGGLLETTEFYKKISEARVMFMPSHEEGWGIAVCEAMALGLPVVAYDLPIYKRVFGNAMRKLDRGDYEAFAKEICSMLDNQELYEDYKKRGHECAKLYDWDAIAKADALKISELLRTRSEY